jgi:two-component system sensor histidine kinase YesM
MKMIPFTNVNLRTKLVLLYVITIVFPLITIGYFIMSVYGSKVIEQTTSITQESTVQTASNIKAMLQQYVDIVNRLSYDQQLNDYLTPSRVYNNDLESIDAYELYLKPVTFYDYNYNEPNAQIKIFFHNTTLLQDGIIYIHADYEVLNLPEYKTARAAEGKLVWGTASGRIYLARAMYTNQGQLAAVVTLQIPENRLYAMISESEKSEKTVLITDNRGNVVSSNHREIVGSSLLGKPYFRPMDQTASYPFDFVDTQTHISYKVIEENLGDGHHFLDWRLLTLIPLDRIINEEKAIRQTGLLVSLLGLIVSCVLFILVLNKITARVKALVKKMQTVKKGELTVMQENGTSDEIGALTRSFNDMIESLQKSIYDNYEVNLMLKDITIKKQEAELYALQNQINPHFLFNTLESIRMGLHNKGDHETSVIVLNLSKLFRNTLYWQGEFIQLKEELEMTARYLAIQKYRFEERIQYSTELPEELADAYIPRLTIQPIVENAVKHGIESISGNGHISIQIRDVNTRMMEISVQDNGSGIDPERLQLIRDQLFSRDIKKTQGIGLKNVHDRLLLHYGSPYGLTIENNDRGVCVKILVPIQWTSQ